ncbi:hypothetical protein ACSBR2_015273 [Camellia fascicularis]
MSPTLDDVSVILGIPVISKSVSCKKLSNVDAANLLIKALRVTIDEANIALKVVRGQSIKVEWLRQRFASMSDADNDNTIECAARAYLLYLLAALAFLYRQLGTATRYVVKQMAGYMTLLEAWIYEHFVGARPHLNLDYKEDQPRVFRWISCIQSDRVLRQFGRVQIIPSPSLAPVRASKGSTAKQYIIAYKYLDTIWESWENHLLSEIARSVLILHLWDCVQGYLD